MSVLLRGVYYGVGGFLAIFERVFSLQPVGEATGFFLCHTVVLRVRATVESGASM